MSLDQWEEANWYVLWRFWSGQENSSFLFRLTSPTFTTTLMKRRCQLMPWNLNLRPTPHSLATLLMKIMRTRRSHIDDTDDKKMPTAATESNPPPYSTQSYHALDEDNEDKKMPTNATTTALQTRSHQHHTQQWQGGLEQHHGHYHQEGYQRWLGGVRGRRWRRDAKEDDSN